MSPEGQRHADELARLETRKKDLEDALMRLARDEAEAQEVAELAQEVEQLEQQVDAARIAANIPKMTAKRNAIMPTNIQKQALPVKKRAEKLLDDLANSLQQPGETFEAAYSRALDTEMGAMMLKTLDDATALATGNPTEFDLEKARAALQ
tara:strand:+ start:2973 stop:3425 length:453 start_codon:yes stop_codon:yes gene_type:complete